MDVDECVEENDGGCDLLALYGDYKSSCTDEAFGGAKFRCGRWVFGASGTKTTWRHVFVKGPKRIDEDLKV